jgi:two-component system sensor histidine kinase DesK
VELGRVDGHCRLEISDDGRGGPVVEGNGLRGMRERVESLGGSLERDMSSGTRLIVELPLGPFEETARA